MFQTETQGSQDGNVGITFEQLIGFLEMTNINRDPIPNAHEQGLDIPELITVMKLTH